MMTGPHGPSFEGREKILEYMALQRDNYGFVHNQTLRLINSGMKIQDVGQAIDDMVPESLSKVWHTHGYHGTYSHNARGVANRYLGFYNGNPAYLNPLPLQSESIKFVEYMGGSDNILEKAGADFEQGEYRFVATALDKLVVAQPDNWPARHLLADAMEQLGYQAEGPQWRNAYLTASKELRTGVISVPEGDSDQSDLLRAATVDDLLDAVAVKIDGPEAADENVAINIHITDTNKRYAVVLSNSNLSYSVVGEFGEADTTLSISRQDLMRLMGGQLKITELISLGAASIDGSPFSLVTLLGLIEKDNRYYPLVPMPEA
jgi:alkyl sulfatase BDS1-like metallo-beta-lactamase superfamily hydrolase